MSRIIFAIQALFAICLGAVKIGLCFMLKRIFVVQTFHVLTWIVMAICIGWVLFTIIIGFTICQPVAMNWDPATPGGTCGNQLAGFAAVGILDLITDGALLLLPVPMVIRLQMRWQHKIALLAIFGAGALTMVFAGMRLHAVLTLDFLDVTYSQVPVVLYGTLEPAIAILVSCSVPLQPLLDAFFTSALRWDRSNSSRNSTKQSSTELSDLSSDKSREGGSFRARSPTPGRGFRQIEEGGYNDLELDGFRRTGRDILVAADSTESFHGSDVGLRVKVVDTVDVTRSERGQRPRG